MSGPAADKANLRFVDQLIALGALWSRPLVEAFRGTPRHHFLDRAFLSRPEGGEWRETILRDAGPEEIKIIYSDRALVTHLNATGPGAAPVPISSSSQPSLMAQMLEDLRPGRGQRILEIGTGTGFNAALLAHVAGQGLVTSVDVDRNVLAEAWDHLRRLPERGIRLKQADGRAGWSRDAPFDRIMVTAATPQVEPAWIEQLVPGGVLVVPLELAPGLSFVLRGERGADGFQGELMRPAYFMPLRAEGENGGDKPEVQSHNPSAESVTAPWAGWFSRRGPRGAWRGFIQSFLFHAWVQGLDVRAEAAGDDEGLYVLNDGERVLWLDPREWLVNGPGARDLGLHLWHAFLEAGAPRPTEFWLRIPGSQGGPGEWVLKPRRERPAWF